MSTTTLPAPARTRPAPERPERRRRGPASTLAARLVAIALVLAVGVFDPWGLRPFTTLRWPLVAVLLLVAAALGWRDRAAIPPGLRAVGLGFLAWMTVATIAAVDPVNAWLGHPQRHLGWLGWVVAAAGFVAGLAVTSDDARRVVGRGAIVASAVIGLGAVLDLAGVDIGGVAGGFGSRAGGFLGQPAYLGAAGVLAVPVAFAASNAEADARWRWLGRVATAAGAVAVVATQTRGAWLGLAVAAAMAWPLVRPRSRAARLRIVIGVVALIGVAALTPIGGRALGTLDLDGGSSRGRLDEWRVAAAVVGDRPVLGAGPEGYRVVAPAEIDDDYTQRHGREVIVDRAHDGVLDVAVTGGIPAALLYGAMVVLVLVRVARARRDERPLVVGTAAAVAGYAAQQLVLFPVAELDPFAWAFAGVVVAAGPLGARACRPPAPATLRPGLVAADPRARRGPTVVGVAAVALAASIAVLGVLGVVADHQLAAAVRDRDAGDPRAALAAADRATALRPDDLDIWYVAADVAASGASLLDVDAALDRVESGLAWSPRDPALLDRQEQLLVERALRSGLADDLGRAEQASRDRSAADPAHPTHHRSLGLVLLAQGDIAGARAALDRALVLGPDDPAALQALARIDAGTPDAGAAAPALAPGGGR